jgi:polysaccharide pyruvyl transferase WcaK-like protein
LLVGNFGAGNVGDELLRTYFVTRFSAVEWTVLSASPVHGEVPRLPLGLRSFFTTPWWRTLAALAKADALVFGGGSLFTDVESSKACWLWGLHAFVAWCFGKKIVLAFQGVGPVKSRTAMAITRWVVRRAAFILVRDPESANRVRAFGRDDVIVTADPVPLLFPETRRGSGNVLVFIPRHNSGHRFSEAAAHAVSNIPHASIRIVSMQPDAEELRTCDAIAKHFGITEIRKTTGLDDLQVSLSDAAHLVTERYHGALAGFMLGVPLSTVSQKKGDKLDTFVSLCMAGLTPAKLRAEALTGEEQLRSVLS